MIGFNEGSRQMVRLVGWDWWKIDTPILKFVFGVTAFSPFWFFPIFKLLLESLGLVALFGRVWIGWNMNWGW